MKKCLFYYCLGFVFLRFGMRKWWDQSTFTNMSTAINGRLLFYHKPSISFISWKPKT